MSRKITKSILSIDEVNLLLKSEEPKNTQLYGNLYEVLSKIDNRKAITMEELSELDQNGQRALSYNKKTLIDTVIKEWYAESTSSEDPNKKIRCGLCNTPNRYLYYIRNRKNGILLNVGSHCITKFPGIEGYIEQKKQLVGIQKNQKRVIRRNEFYDRFEDPELTISNADNYFRSLPILLPNDIYVELEDTIKRMRLIYNRYVDDGKKAFESEYDVFKLFGLAVNKFEKLKAKAKQFIKQNVNNPLSCRRREIDWILNQDKPSLLEYISKNDGKYTEPSLMQMYSYDFVKDYFELFKSRNSSEVYEIDRLETGEIIFLFNKFGYNPSIVYSIKLSDFMYNIGAKCILKRNYTYKSIDIQRCARIHYSNRNLNSILNYVDNMINRMNCVFLLDNSTNTLILYRKGDSSIRSFDKNKFIDSYNAHILQSDLGIKKYMISLVKGTKATNWISTDQQEKYGNKDKIQKLYEEYRAIHSNSISQSISNIEVMVYDVVKNNRNCVINFNNPEYVSFKRERIRTGNQRVRLIDYGIKMTGHQMLDKYKKGDVLLVQITKKVDEGDTFLYETNDGLSTIRILHEANSIFEYLDVDKKRIKPYGKIIYCIKAKNEE